MKAYPIYERFSSFQGEGCYAGQAAFFIRTYGCPVRCPWCDSAGTWHPDHRPASVEKMGARQLANDAAAVSPEFVVVTGGEPAIYDLTELVEALHAVHLPVHLETSGGFPIKGDFDWVTMSPKRERPPLPENFNRTDEFKIIVDKPTAIDEMRNLITSWTGQPVWLHLEWSQRDNAELRALIVDHVKRFGHLYRAGVQMHKHFQADALDGRSRPLVPLGGDPKLGY